MSARRLSALVVCHNEAAQLEACLTTLTFADEIVVVLDKCTDGSKSIAARFTDRLVEGSWALEGPRRNIGIATCTGDWILEVDADERVSEALAGEVRSVIADAAPGYFLVPFDNYVGGRLVKYGWGASWGVMSAPRLFSRGAKRWGDQYIHPRVDLSGPKRRLRAAMIHHVDRGLDDMLARLQRYADARALDLRSTGTPLPPFAWTLRRGVSRFLKCYFLRKGYREGRWGFTIALMAALFPVLAHLKAELDEPSEQ